MERNRSLDFLKMLCAFFVVCIHAQLPKTISDIIVPVCRTAVPLFFMITGYYYSRTKEKQAEMKQLMKLVRLFISATVLFLLWSALCCLLKKQPLFPTVSDAFNVNTIVNLLLLNMALFGGHLWYLKAIIYVLLVVFLFEKVADRRKLYPLIPILTLGNLILGAYSPLLLGQTIKLLVTRNFFFTGLPAFLMGDLIYRKQFKIKATVALILSVVFWLATILEASLLNAFQVHGKGEVYICNALSAFFAFLFATQYHCTRNTPLYQTLCNIGAKFSTTIYILHPIVITTLGTFTVFIGQLFKPAYGLYYIQPFLVFAITIFLAWVNQRIIAVFKRKSCSKKKQKLII